MNFQIGVFLSLLAEVDAIPKPSTAEQEYIPKTKQPESKFKIATFTTRGVHITAVAKAVTSLPYV